MTDPMARQRPKTSSLINGEVRVEVIDKMSK